MTTGLYLDTSAVLRAVLETGTTPEVEARIRQATVLITSRLSLVESARALQRLVPSRRRISGLELLTVDERLQEASGAL